MSTLLEVRKRKKRAEAGGGDDRVATQHRQGKKTARERIELLLDHDSFSETDQLATSPHLQSPPPGDGAVTGFGTIEGRRVALYAQDFTVRGGSLGQRQAQKICKVMDMAAKIGCPIIGIIDSGGARIDEGIHALAGYGDIFMRNVRYSGVVPQISIILGPCAGGAVYSPALTDVIFTVEGISQLFITGPQVIKQVLGIEMTKDELGGARVHAEQSGVVHHVSADEESCIQAVKQFLTYVPNNYREELPSSDFVDVRAPLDPGIIVPTEATRAYDMRDVIGMIIDQDTFFELQELFAPNIITGFARIDGRVVGIVGNQPAVRAGTLDINASTKAARFINLCDAFGIPVVSLVDVPGYLPGIEQEHQGIIRHGAKLLHAYAAATVPKITVILRKAYGGAYIVMGSKHLGADFNIAWPSAQIAVMGARGAVQILHRRKLQAIVEDSERESHRKALEKDYEETFLTPFVAAESGYIDTIIEPIETRETLIKALAIAAEKVEKLPKRKRNNQPV